MGDAVDDDEVVYECDECGFAEISPRPEADVFSDLWFCCSGGSGPSHEEDLEEDATAAGVSRKKTRQRISALEAVIKNLDEVEDYELVQSAKAKLKHYKPESGQQSGEELQTEGVPAESVDQDAEKKKNDILVRKWQFRGRRAAIDHSRRQILRGIFKFFLAGLCQSQFGCHLQIDYVSVSYETWGASSNGTLLGVFLNLINMALQLLASRDIFYLHYQIRKHKGTSCCNFESAAFFCFLLLVLGYALSFLYLIMKVVGYFSCETSIYTLVGGCVRRN